MENKPANTLAKEERLSRKRDLDLLFEKGQSFVVFPLRVVYLVVEAPQPAPLSMLVSVPKKRIKKAVGRNYIKRRVREAYRLHKHELVEEVQASGNCFFLAFMYIDKNMRSFHEIEKALMKSLEIIRKKK
jgi:ribonuclease P protein component